MANAPLANYLRTYRKTAGLTCGEVAFLMGNMGAGSVSDHEIGKSLPLVKNILMYEMIYGVQARLLFEGIFEEAKAILRTRARGHAAYLLKQGPSPERNEKLALLSKMGADDLPTIEF